MEANGTSNGNGIGNSNGTAPTGNHKFVYTVVENKNGGKSFWVKIGVAFTNRDGSLTVRLDALPLNGTMQVREPAAWEDRRPELASAGSTQRHVSEAFA
jgi:hypothetical protein